MNRPIGTASRSIIRGYLSKFKHDKTTLSALQWSFSWGSHQVPGVFDDAEATWLVLGSLHEAHLDVQNKLWMVILVKKIQFYTEPDGLSIIGNIRNLALGVGTPSHANNLVYTIKVYYYESVEGWSKGASNVSQGSLRWRAFDAPTQKTVKAIIIHAIHIA